MRHKKLHLVLIFAFVLSISAELKNVRYISGHIKNIDNNLITLTGDLAFRVNEHVTAISMMPAVFVLEEDRPEGFVFIKDRKIDVTLMKNSGGKFLLPATTQDYHNYTKGELSQIKSLSLDDATIDLDNDEKWFLTDKTESKMIKNWKEGDLVIITSPQHSGELIINTRTTEQTKISNTHEVTISK